MPVYDLVGGRYNLSLDGFYELTLRQVYKLQKQVLKAQQDENVFQATLHGKEIKGANLAPIERSKEENDKIMQASEYAMKELRKRHFMETQKNGK